MDSLYALKPISYEPTCASSRRTNSSNAAYTTSEAMIPSVENRELEPGNGVAVVENQRSASGQTIYPGVEDVHDSHSRSAPLFKVEHNPPVIRKFESLHTRVMLFREYELHNLEQELSAMDFAAENTNDTTQDRISREERSWGGRTDLVNRIDDKLREYHDAVQRAKSFSALPKPAKRKSGTPNDTGAQYPILAHLEANTSDEDGDLISISDRNGAWFYRQLQTQMVRLWFRLHIVISILVFVLSLASVVKLAIDQY